MYISVTTYIFDYIFVPIVINDAELVRHFNVVLRHNIENPDP